MVDWNTAACGMLERNGRSGHFAQCLWAVTMGWVTLVSLPAQAGGGGQNMLLVVNPGDENALRIAQAYQQTRDIPDSNIVFVEPRYDRGSYRAIEGESWNGSDYVDHYLQPIADHLTAHNLVGQIDYIAGLGQPIRMHNDNSSSTTRALSSSYTYTQLDALMGGATGVSLAGYWSSQTTPLYQDPSSYTLGSNAAIHHSDDGLYMGGSVGFTGLFGNTADQVIASLQRTVAADGAKPAGTIYFEENGDIRSIVREPQWSTTQTMLTARNVAWIQEQGGAPANRDDVRGAVVGTSNMDVPNGSTYLPGSWADNLTSYGASFDNRSQNKTTLFIAAGAAATSGSVYEPFAVTSRFTHSNVHVYNADGSTLAEAFYKSVKTPDLQLFLGDMLAQPYADVPDVLLTGNTPAQNAVVANTIQLEASASLSQPTLATGIDRLELYVDGKLADTAVGAGATFNFDTTTLSDGHHELRVVAVNNAAAESQNHVLRHITVNNHGQSVAVVGGDTQLTPDQTANLQVQAVAGPGNIDRIELRHLGRSLGQVNASTGTIALNAGDLAFGDNTIVAVSVFDDGSEVAGTPITVTRDKPWQAGHTPTVQVNRLAGIKGEYFLGQGDNAIGASDFTGPADLEVLHSRIFIGVPDSSQTLLDDGAAPLADMDALAVGGNDLDQLAVRLSAKFEVTADTAGEFSFFAYKSSDALRLSIDGETIMAVDYGPGYGITTHFGESVFLTEGEHDLELLASNLDSWGEGGVFDIGLYYRTSDGITRIADDNFLYQAVPEPTTLILLGLGGVLLNCRRRHCE